MRKLIVENGIVVNVILADDDFVLEGVTLIADEFAGPGWLQQADGSFAPPPAPAPVIIVPQVISDRQFFEGLAILNVITEDEALAAVQIGAIPEVLQVMVNAIADPQAKFSAKMLLSGATEFKRNHPLTMQFGYSYFAATVDKTVDQQIDAFFIMCNAL